MRIIRKSVCVLAMLACSFNMLKAQTADPNIPRAERMFQYVLDDKSDSLYANMDASVQGMITPKQFVGLLGQIEAQAGKYQSHGSWTTENVMGMTAYVCPMKFANADLACLVIFSESGKMKGLQMVPAEMLKKNNRGSSVRSGQSLP